ncbi:hypothetical protein RUM44_009134 [Polyplax serrata]|uniref:Uncharacterized protein n=1 Tax=Polyplax serrata TaxID=468196 RepID=A0ABR1AS34_POLSC
MDFIEIGTGATRSPRSTRKTLPRPLPKRRLSNSPKRNMTRKSREDVRMPLKRPRDSTKPRSKSPRQASTSLPPRRPLSRERFAYSDMENAPEINKKLGPLKPKYVEKPSCEGSMKDFTRDREELKNFKMRIYRDISGGSTQINRSIVHPEDITIARRPEIISHSLKTADVFRGDQRIGRIQNVDFYFACLDLSVQLPKSPEVDLQIDQGLANKLRRLY